LAGLKKLTSFCQRPRRKSATRFTAPRKAGRGSGMGSPPGLTGNGMTTAGLTSAGAAFWTGVLLFTVGRL
jgi:hypothetical protein